MDCLSYISPERGWGELGFLQILHMSHCSRFCSSHLYVIFFFEGVRQWSMCLLREFYRRSVYSCCNQLSRIKCKPYMIPFPASTSSICRSNFSSFLALMYFRCWLFVRLFDVVWSDKVYCNWNHHYLRNMLFQAWLFICTLMCGHITQEVHAHFNLSPISRGRVFILTPLFRPYVSKVRGKFVGIHFENIQGRLFDKGSTCPCTSYT